MHHKLLQRTRLAHPNATYINLTYKYVNNTFSLRQNQIAPVQWGKKRKCVEQMLK